MSRLMGSGVLLVLATAACDRGPPESLLSEPIEDGVQLRAARARGLPSAAASAIAQARCAREQRCGSVGADRQHASNDECTRAIRAEWVDELNALACPRGVDEAALAACLRVIDQSDCSDVLDALERWSACAASDICDVPPEPPPAPLSQDPAVPG